MKNKIAPLTGILSLITFFSFAQSGIKTKSVAVFKNGSGFFIKTGTVKPTKGTVSIEDTIDATFGTLWFSSDDNTITSVTSKMEQVEHLKPANAANTAELLKANIGKKVKVSVKDEQPVEATIEKVEDDMVILKASGNWVHFKISWLNRIDFEEQPVYSTTEKQTARVITMDFKDDKESKVNIMYLQHGIGWLPTYLVELMPDNKARLTLTANMVNDAEDLDNADVSLVVGVPNFKYSNELSPLTSTQSLSEFLSALSYGAYPAQYDQNRLLSNAVISQQSYGYNGDVKKVEEDASVSDNEPFSLGGARQEDLFFYRLNSISLKKGGRGFYTVLKEDVPFRHIYEAELAANTISGEYYSMNTSGDSFDNNEQNTNKVYHSIELENTSKLPWTTGSAMVVKSIEGNTGPLSQDILTYTPMKAKVTVKITQAPDISVKDAESETARVERSKVVQKVVYDLVSVSASITVKNYKDEDIDLTVKRTINGDLQSCSMDWDTKKVLNLYKNANTVNDVKWAIHLKAGEEKKVTYKYQVYVER